MSAAQCGDGDACTTDVCESGGRCSHTPVTCGDGNACTTDTCAPASGCVYTPVTCSDGDACTTDSCAPASGCVYTPVVCNDGDACTADQCSAGACVARPTSGAGCADGVVTGGMNVVHPIIDATTDLYSPTVVLDPSGAYYHLWIGGFRDMADRARTDGRGFIHDGGTPPGTAENDRVFHATSTNLTSWTWDPDPVLISTTLHLNDPSVVLVDDPSPTGQKVFLMYLTGCGTVDDCYSEGGNVTYGATSYDGVHWSTPTLVIGRSNGVNGGGAWAPSVLKRSNTQLWLFFNDHYANILRATVDLAATGFFVASDVRLVRPVSAGYAANVDVSLTSSGVYEMLYNGLSSGAFDVRRAISSDGLTWAEDPWFPPLGGAPNGLLTPHAVHLTASTYWLFFGFHDSTGTSVHQWRFSRARPR